jgi:hypothetical protein
MRKRIGFLVTDEEYARIESLLKSNPLLDQASLLRAAVELAIPGTFPEYSDVELPKLKK